MKIELVVVRDPDSANDITWFIDGVPIAERADVEVVEYHVDPGAGHQYSDWIASARAELATCSQGPVADFLALAYQGDSESQYIEDDVACDRCGRWLLLDLTTERWSHKDNWLQRDNEPCSTPTPPAWVLDEIKVGGRG